MPLLSRITPHPFRAQDLPIWGQIDTLYDYAAFIQQGPIAQLPQEQWGQPVAIIGAGAAGLVAAYELLKIGARPLIFEASDRLGGRAYSYRFPRSEVIAELGSMRFPPSGRLFFYYLDDVFNLRDRATFPDPGKVPTRLYYENQIIDWPAGADAPKDPDFQRIGHDWGTFISGLSAPFVAAWKAGDRNQLQALWQQAITTYKDTSFYAGVRQGIPQWSDEDLNKFGALGIGSGGFGPVYEADFLEIFRLVVNGWEDDQQFLPFGISQFVEQFYLTPVETPWGDRLSLQQLDAVRFNHRVTGLDYDGQNPILSWIDNDGNAQQAAFPAVIPTLSTRAMEIMGMTLVDYQRSPLSESVKTALRNLHLTNSSKLFVRTRSKFWLEHNLPANIQTDELPRGVYALDYPDRYNPEGNGVVLVSYTWEDDSSKLLSLSPLERLSLFRRSIAKASPQFAALLEPAEGETDVVCCDWQTEPGYYGAFKLQYPGQEPNLQAAYYQFLSVHDPNLDRGVYLAGDGVSWAGGWSEGALTVGLNAACAAAARLGAEVRPGSPLTQDPQLYTYA